MGCTVGKTPGKVVGFNREVSNKSSVLGFNQKKRMAHGVLGIRAPVCHTKQQWLDEFLKSKHAVAVLDEFVNMQIGCGFWTVQEAADHTEQVAEEFEKVGVGLFFCHYVDNDLVGTSWFEFVDLNVNPDYVPLERVKAERSRPPKIVEI
jgi:hypothetical protein